MSTDEATRNSGRIILYKNVLSIFLKGLCSVHIKEAVAFIILKFISTKYIQLCTLMSRFLPKHHMRAETNYSLESNEHLRHELIQWSFFWCMFYYHFSPSIIYVLSYSKRLRCAIVCKKLGFSCENEGRKVALYQMNEAQKYLRSVMVLFS